MRAVIAAFALASLLGTGTATAAQQCGPGAMGVSRTIVVDPSEHQRLGSQQYSETLPLRDKEVVLTFDDGPLPPYTNRILDTLASECVKATFFMVGRMVRGYPNIVRRIYNEGHTVANHSQNHPFTFHKMSVEQAAQEIEDGFESLRTVLGPKAVAPFFRIPGLLRQSSVEQYLASHNVMTWSVDFLADDWTHISAQEIARRAINRMESHRKGILLLHDIQPATALAFPEILQELKERGYKIVHVVPSTPDRPKTVAAPEQWATRGGGTPEMKVWPRVVSVEVKSEEPALEVPSPRSFGLPDAPDAAVKVELVKSFDRPPVREGEIPLPPVTPWPRQMYTVPIAEDGALPVPGAHNFKYARVFQMPNSDRTRKPAPATQTASKPKDTHQPGTTGSTPARQEASATPRQNGHVFSGLRGPLQIFQMRRD